MDHYYAEAVKHARNAASDGQESDRALSNMYALVAIANTLSNIECQLAKLAETQAERNDLQREASKPANAA